MLQYILLLCEETQGGDDSLFRENTEGTTHELGSSQSASQPHLLPPPLSLQVLQLSS